MDETQEQVGSDRKVQRHDVPLAYLSNFEAALSRLSAKADKLGLPPIEFNVVATTESVAVVEVGCEPVQLEGWRLRAAFDWSTEGDEPLVHTLPGMDLAKPPDACQCDHCGTVRDRVRSYLVEHDDGRTAQVGSSCLSDFVGADSAEVVLMRAQADLIREFDADPWAEEKENLGLGFVLPVPMVCYLATCRVLAEYEGFVTAAESERSAEAGYQLAPTWEWAAELSWGASSTLPDGMPEQDKKAWSFGKSTYNNEKWINEAKSIIEEMKASPEDNANEFMSNLRRLAIDPVVRPKHMPMAATIVNVVMGWRHEHYTHEHYGEKGKRAELTATFESRRVIEPYHYRGPMRALLRFRSEQGHSLSWLTDAKNDVFDRGETYRIKATVKDHKTTANGVPYTSLNRLVVLERDEPKLETPSTAREGR